MSPPGWHLRVRVSVRSGGLRIVPMLPSSSERDLIALGGPQGLKTQKTSITWMSGACPPSRRYDLGRSPSPVCRQARDTPPPLCNKWSASISASSTLFR